jgi:hypothetical protein
MQGTPKTYFIIWGVARTLQQILWRIVVEAAQPKGCGYYLYAG